MWILGLAGGACGGTTVSGEVDNAFAAGPAPAGSSAPATFVFGDGAAPRVFCTSCRDRTECAAGELCVPGSGGGGGICATGCSKEGFCASDHVCISFPSVPGEADWRACVPIRGCGAVRDGARRASSYAAVPVAQ